MGTWVEAQGDYAYYLNLQEQYQTCKALGDFPVRLDEPTVAVNRLARNREEIAKRVARLRMLQFAWPQVLPIITGFSADQFQFSEKPTCSRYGGTCCICPTISLSTEEFHFLRAQGLIAAGFICEANGTIRTDILDKIIHRLQRPHDAMKAEEFKMGRRIGGLEFSHGVNTTETLGSCPYVNASGRCECHTDSKRPSACGFLQEGSDDCRKRFLPKDHVAWQFIDKILSDADPVLIAIEQIFGQTRKQRVE